MSAGIKKSLGDIFYKYRFNLLLITLILNFFIPPLTMFPFFLVFFKLMTTAFFLMSGANFIQKDKKHLRKLWFIFGFIIILVSVFSDLTPENIFFESVRYILLCIFFIVITVSLLQQIFKIKNVTVDVITGAFCGYLLIGIISFFLMAMIEYFFPGSLSGLSDDNTRKITQIFYFTFTTLTTIGFGDIVPLNMMSQKLAVFTATIGQFYIAVIVAILVSRFLNRPSGENEIS